MSDAKEMPHIDLRYDPASTATSVNIFPDAEALAAAYVDIIRAFGWESFTILFENGRSVGSESPLPRWINKMILLAPYMIGMSELLKLYDPKGETITVRQLDLGISNNYRAILRRVQQSGEKYIVLHCSVEILPEVLKQAQQVGLMTDDHYFIITSLDLHTVDLEPYQYGGTNITGMRLIDPEDARTVQITNYWREKEELKGVELPEGLDPQKISTQVALMVDSVLLYAEVFNQLQGTRQIEATSLSCEDSETWVSGYSFANFMKTTHVRGLTRDIKFDHKGKRTDFSLDIVELDSSGLIKVGVWNGTDGMHLSRLNIPSSLAGEEGSLKNRSFIVLTALVMNERDCCTPFD